MRRPVKCLPFRLAARGRPGAVALALFGAGLLAAAPGHAQILFGPADAPRQPIVLDERIPRGALQYVGVRPASPAPPGCSFQYPVCVHPRPGGSARESEWLAAMKSAYERLVLVLGLPSPRSDGARGGSPSLDLYLGAPGTSLRVDSDGPDVASPFDEAAAFCVAPEDEAVPERAATLCVGEAIALGLDAAETPFSRRALATDLWFSTGKPTSADAEAIDDAQSNPERGAVARDRSRFAEGGALFLQYLDAAKGRGVPSGVSLATYALSAGTPSPPAWRYVNEPDTLDVLRTTFAPTPSDGARLFADFAVARAFLGSRDAEGAWPELAWVGDFGRVRFEWSVPFSSLPRQLAPARPIEPTGATYLWVSMNSPAGQETLVFQANSEPPASFRWAIVVVGAEGRPLRRVDPPFLERDGQVQRVVGDLSGATGVLIAGTNLGGLGPSYPFDPDFEPYEPHAYSVYLARQ